MNFVSFLKDKLLQIILLLFVVMTIEIFLLVFPNSNFIKIYIPLSILSMYFLAISIEYFQKKHFFDSVYQALSELKEKYLLAEVIGEPHFLEGKLLKEILEIVDTSMLENVNQYKYLQEDYQEYIEMWIHEIKIPIATSKMMMANHQTKVTKSIDEEIGKIEDYIEQALFYARSNHVEKDYYIAKHALSDMVNEVLRKNKKVLMGEKMILHDLDLRVNTDSKWIVFLLNQIIQNSVKYRKKGCQLVLEIYAKQGKENITLYVQDNGMGMKQEEQSRAFEKGFTGTNGRLLNKKSTGIGLYLCKKLCDKLGIGITLEAEEGKGTCVSFTFPQNSYMDIK